MMSTRVWFLFLLLGGLTAGVLVYLQSRPGGGGQSSPPDTEILPDAPDPAPQPTNVAAKPAGVRDEVRPLVARKLSPPGPEAGAARPTPQIAAPMRSDTVSSPPGREPEAWSYPPLLLRNASNTFVYAMTALAGAKSEQDRYLTLGNAAKSAFIFGQTEDARNYATELLALEKKFKGQPWADGGAAYEGNQILGRIAVQEDRIAEAKQYLLAAGQSTGSPVLGSFGPNLCLARDLLQRGERDTVLEFFDRAGKFWKNEMLGLWAEDVKAGRTPDFGSNLIY
jgi:hypothetical protein